MMQNSSIKLYILTETTLNSCLRTNLSIIRKPFSMTQRIFGIIWNSSTVRMKVANKLQGSKLT